ncbi:MAG: argininosuccinate lyase, partial [Candidatus Binatia bacterium]
LAEKGMPFRQAHAVVGAVVRHCLQTGKELEKLTLAELRRFSTRFDRDVFDRLTPEEAIARRRAPGGTARENVEQRLEKMGV